MCSLCEASPVWHEGYTRQPRSCQYSSARRRRAEQSFRIYVESRRIQGMSHDRLLAAALLLVGPAIASAQPAAFAQATQTLAQSAITRNNNDFAAAVRQMGAALAEWDHQLKAQEARVAGDMPAAPVERQYQFHVELGLALQMRGRADDALREFDAAAQLQPGSAQVQLLRGLTFQSSGRQADTASAFRSAWTHDANNPVAAYYLLRHVDRTTPDE